MNQSRASAAAEVDRAVVPRGACIADAGAAQLAVAQRGRAAGGVVASPSPSTLASTAIPDRHAGPCAANGSMAWTASPATALNTGRLGRG
jgi:hypothetical protein